MSEPTTIVACLADQSYQIMLVLQLHKIAESHKLIEQMPCVLFPQSSLSTKAVGHRHSRKNIFKISQGIKKYIYRPAYTCKKLNYPYYLAKVKELLVNDSSMKFSINTCSTLILLVGQVVELKSFDASLE